jgi:hypothetical protein
MQMIRRMEWKGKERKGKERKGKEKERKGMERKGRGSKEIYKWCSFVPHLFLL